MPAKTLPTIAITIGEPAGIGPVISLRAACALCKACRPILIGDYSLLEKINTDLKGIASLRRIHYESLKNTRQNDYVLEVIHIPLHTPVIAGNPDKSNARAILACLDLAIQGAEEKKFDAIVTAPIQKSIINEAGIPFTGHTEYIAAKTHAEKVVMMLSGYLSKRHEHLRVALATTHLAVKDVPDAITLDGLVQTLQIIHAELQQKFGIVKPRIFVTGLNPHAGENGYLGTEEIDIISPAILKARKNNIDAQGPFPADTIFQPQYLDNTDCILAMYHDQGLPVLKHASFGHSINITLGLPIIRTSVDHGTALDIALRGAEFANDSSMKEAIQTAIAMANRKNQSFEYGNS